MTKIYATLTLIAGLIGLAMLWPPHNTQAAQKPYIVTTTAQIGDIVSNIAGPNMRVEFLMGTGVDPHLYRPTRSDVIKLKRADIVFYNGLHLEGQMAELLEKLGEKKPAIAIAESLPAGAIHEDEKGAHDPHIWMDVKNWISGTDIVTRTLADYAPEQTGQFTARASAYKEKLKQLDAHTKEAIASIPENKRVLVTAHDAFGYLGFAYDIEVFGIQGISTDSEAGLKRMEELVSLLVEREIPAIFIESSVSDRNIRALIEGAAARGYKVTIGGELYSDAMGKYGTYEGTYIGMMDHNINVITSALSGNTTPLQDRMALNTE